MTGKVEPAQEAEEAEGAEEAEEVLEEAVSEAPEELGPDEPPLEEAAEPAEELEAAPAHAEAEAAVTEEPAEEEGVPPLPEEEGASADVAEEAEESVPLVAVADDETASGDGAGEEAVTAPDEEAVAAPDEEAVAAPDEEAVAALVEEAQEEEEPLPGEPVFSSGPGMNWYIVHTYSGYESKVKTSLEERIMSLELKDRIPQILVPSEPVVEIKGGKKRISDRKFFPGYILVEMELSDDTWYLIKNTPKVTGFLGGGRHPTPLPSEEIQYIIEQLRGEAEKPKLRVLFERGENVRIVDGPFTNFTGAIDEVDEIRGKLKVMVSIFGRATPVEMEFLQVEKV
jgi:transcriptional antiterminator NusG